MAVAGRVCRLKMVYFSPCCQKVIILCLVGNVLLLVTAPICINMAFSVYMWSWFNVCVKFTKDRRIYCDETSQYNAQVAKKPFILDEKTITCYPS